MADTIYALSSGGLPSGVAVIRISGPQTSTALERLCGICLRQGRPRCGRFAIETMRCWIRDSCIYFPAPASFTGEDCAELQVHGGRAVVDAVLAAI